MIRGKIQQILRPSHSAAMIRCIGQWGAGGVLVVQHACQHIHEIVLPPVLWDFAAVLAEAAKFAQARRGFLRTPELQKRLADIQNGQDGKCTLFVPADFDIQKRAFRIREILERTCRELRGNGLLERQPYLGYRWSIQLDCIHLELIPSLSEVEPLVAVRESSTKSNNRMAPSLLIGAAS